MRYAVLLLILLILPLIQVHALPKVGEKAPYFNVPTYEGDRVSTERLKGKVAVIAFAAEWCPHCRKELPLLSEAWKENGLVRNDTIFVVMMVSSEKEKAIGFYKSLNPPSNWRLVLDANSVADKYDIVGVPTAIVLDKEGKIVKILVGERPPQDIIDPVRELLGLIPKGNYTSPSPTVPAQTSVQTPENTNGLKLGHILLIGLGIALLIIFGVWYYRTLKKSETPKKKRKEKRG